MIADDDLAATEAAGGAFDGGESLGENRLERCAFVGGGARWQGASKLGRLVTGLDAAKNRIFGETFFGPEDFKLDGFLGYRRKLSGNRFRPELTVQINVTNLTGEDSVMPLRYNPDKSGYTRVLLFEPRKFRLTAGMEF